MTSPTPPANPMAQQLAAEHAALANELAKPIEDDLYLEPGMKSVVRAYRALAHALIATWALQVPDALVTGPDGSIDPSIAT